MLYINDIIFDAVDQTIKRNEHTVQLNNRSTQLLVLFAKNANQTLSRDTIIDAIWSREYVSDHSLTQAVSDLRRALSEIDPSYKSLVKTRPKSGYTLCANVDIENENVQVILSSAGFATKSLKQWATYLPTLCMFCLIGALLHNNWSNPAEKQVTFNPYKVAFLTFDSPEKYIHIAYGLSDLLAYRINQQGYYHASLVYSEDNDFARDATIVISGEIIEREQGPELVFVVTNNMNNKTMFKNTYPLSMDEFVSTPREILLDVGDYMAEPFSAELVAKLNDNYPLEPNQLNLMYQAHYASNITNSRSLYSAIRLYDEVLSHNDTLEIAAAERFISARILMDTQPGSISNDEYQSMYRALLSINSEIHPPIYYEALSVYQFDLGELESAKSLLQVAAKVRGSWLGYILAGKYAEQEKSLFRANVAYKRAYEMKPNESTELVIKTLLFYSKFER